MATKTAAAALAALAIFAASAFAQVPFVPPDAVGAQFAFGQPTAGFGKVLCARSTKADPACGLPAANGLGVAAPSVVVWGSDAPGRVDPITDLPPVY